MMTAASIAAHIRVSAAADGGRTAAPENAARASAILTLNMKGCETMAEIDHRQMMRHALGLPNKTNCSYRNYYAAPIGTHVEKIWDALVTLGCAEKGEPGRMLVGYVLTRKGAESVLLKGETLDKEDFGAP